MQLYLAKVHPQSTIDVHSDSEHVDGEASETVKLVDGERGVD
jgi:hypothetical protein